MFHMHSGEREILIEEHTFYVSEAKKRLLSQFSNIEGEVSALEESYLSTLGEAFNPDQHHESDLYEAVEDKTVNHYLALESMKNNVTLAVVAGMYHLFDKAIREKTIRELGHCFGRKYIAPVVWEISHSKLMELLQWVGATDRSAEFAHKINLCQQVVNVYKHGDGDSHRRLRKSNPEYYQESSYSKFEWFEIDHSELELSEGQVDEFASAIEEFWLHIPDNCFEDDRGVEPDWLAKLYLKHQRRIDS